MKSILSSQLSIITQLEEYNEIISQVKSAFYNLEEVERLEAEDDQSQQVVSMTSASNTVFTLKSSNFPCSFIDAKNSESLSAEAIPAVPSHSKSSSLKEQTLSSAPINQSSQTCHSTLASNLGKRNDQKRIKSSVAVSPPQPKCRQMSDHMLENMSVLRQRYIQFGITPQPLKVEPLIKNTRFLQLLDQENAPPTSSTSVHHKFGFNLSKNTTLNDFRCEEKTKKDSIHFRKNWAWSKIKLSNKQIKTPATSPQ